MATGPGVNQGKSKFVMEVLGRDSQTTDAAIVEAWNEAGNEDSISGSLIYKIRSRMGLTGQGRARAEDASRRSRAKAPAKGKKAARVTESASAPPQASGRRSSKGTAGASQAGDQDRVLDELEGDIDELMFKIKTHGEMPEVQEVLRAARRLLVQKHQE